MSPAINCLRRGKNSDVEDAFTHCMYFLLKFKPDGGAEMYQQYIEAGAETFKKVGLVHFQGLFDFHPNQVVFFGSAGLQGRFGPGTTQPAQ